MKLYDKENKLRKFHPSSSPVIPGWVVKNGIAATRNTLFSDVKSQFFIKYKLFLGNQNIFHTVAVRVGIKV